MAKDDVGQRVDQLFDAGYRCAESVLLIVAEKKKITSDLIPRLGTGFCAGISRTCGTCGAVTGAVMAINLFYGRNDPSLPLPDSYPPIQRFIKGFEEKFGSTNCLQLIDCDLGTEEGRQKFLDAGVVETCKDFTAEATRMALTIIDEKK
ncbi:MAG: C-GCAxxG-C-C family protein [Deltaproteobacteria bacterium]|nr:C-GCAxxG-C-C family protein [Deltaproteobacteria bacterium]